jgi:hypothetical protein
MSSSSASTVPGEAIATLAYVFATAPALVSYSDTAGNSGQIVYPVAQGGPGTPANPLPVAAPPGGDVVLTLTLWRPQRRPIPSESCLNLNPPCSWVDTGGLRYNTVLSYVGSPPRPFLGDTSCHPPVTDPAQDCGANPTNTFTYTANLSECVRSQGDTWSSGEPLRFILQATTNGAGRRRGKRRLPAHQIGAPEGLAPPTFGSRRTKRGVDSTAAAFVRMRHYRGPSVGCCCGRKGGVRGRAIGSRAPPLRRGAALSTCALAVRTDQVVLLLERGEAFHGRLVGEGAVWSA